MGERITDKEFFNKDAKTLAEKLLGKVICYKEQKYMITVTEAYPAEDCYSYVNTEDHMRIPQKKSIGYNCLINENDNCPGICFLNYNGIHIVGKLNKNANKYDHVLIRGGVKVIVDTNELVLENTEMNFKTGRSGYLIDYLFGDDKKNVVRKLNLCDKNNNLFLETYQVIDDSKKSEKRIGLKTVEKMQEKYYFSEDVINDYRDRDYRFYFYPKLKLQAKENI